MSGSSSSAGCHVFHVFHVGWGNRASFAAHVSGVATELLLGAGLFLAWSNGANDNLKGAATLLGSHTLGPRGALYWGTATTLAGSLTALSLSTHLLGAFSGRGIVSESLVGDPGFLLATGLGAAVVVMAATLRGLPVSTTHALVGGLAGAGLARAGAASVEWLHLASSFALPLLVGPLLAVGLVSVVYPLAARLRRHVGIDHETCLCVGVGAEQRVVGVPRAATAATATVSAMATRSAMATAPAVMVVMAPTAECITRYRGAFLGLRAQIVIDVLHALAAGMVGFARGLNDTPKIAAIVLASGAATRSGALAWVGGGMAVGALAQALRVGRTLGFGITPLNSGQGLVANVVTSVVVVGASRLGLPVSTTHVSAGALFGLGASTRGLVRSTFRRILVAWVATLPAAFLVAAAVSAAVGGL